MKKWMAALVCGALLISLTACNDTTPKKPLEEETEATENHLLDSLLSAESLGLEETVYVDEVAELENPVLVDSDRVKIEVKSLITRNGKVSMTTSYTNKTDKEISVTTEHAAINGIMCDLVGCGWFFDITTVPASETITNTVMIETQKFESYKISSFKTIENVFEVRGDKESGYAVLEQPYAVLNVNPANEYTQEVDLSGTTVYDADGIQLIVTGVTTTEGEAFDIHIGLTAVNKRDHATAVYVEKLYLNDIELRCADYGNEMLANTVRYKPYNIANSYFETKNITELKSVQVKFSICDLETDTVIRELTDKIDIPM